MGTPGSNYTLRVRPYSYQSWSKSGTMVACDQLEITVIRMWHLSEAFRVPRAGIEGTRLDAFVQLLLNSDQLTHMLSQLLLIQEVNAPLNSRGRGQSAKR